VTGDDDGHVYFFDVGEVWWITSNVIAIARNNVA
jgi:hypothetical protein